MIVRLIILGGRKAGVTKREKKKGKPRGRKTEECEGGGGGGGGCKQVN